jgi:hypothetical protein
MFNFYLSLKKVSEDEIKEINNRRKSINGILGRKKTKRETRLKLQRELGLLDRKVLTMQKEVVDYSTYLAVIKEFNSAVLEELAKGKTFVIGFRLGTLRIIKKKHNPNKKRVNYNETKKAGKPIYYTDKYYLMFNWGKARCNIPNKLAYRFDPSYSDTHKNGARDRLVELMQNDEFYKFDLK